MSVKIAVLGDVRNDIFLLNDGKRYIPQFGVFYIHLSGAI
jgi:hypothetical protein